MKLSSLLAAFLTLGTVTTGCRPSVPEASTAHVEEDTFPSFADDVAFLRRHGPVDILEAPGGGRVALSAKYQGRVMTSAVSPEGASLGWINRVFIEEPPSETAFFNYGGEDRFWLGPEAGQFGLYFAPGARFELSQWDVPADLDEGEWTVRSRTDTSLTYTRPMRLSNYSGGTFDLHVERTIRLLSPDEVESEMGLSLPEDVRWVGYETVNRVTNTGSTAWMKEKGLLSIWILGMYKPFDTTYVVIPLKKPASAKAVNDEYFGKVPGDRLNVREDHAVFLADGAYRSKIGVGPAHAKAFLGSYNPSRSLLTLVHYTLPAERTDYVNSLWEMQDEPFSGDVVNAYNDGPPNPGGFYELESSSPALALKPGESYTHTHRTLHVVGGPGTLNPLAEKALGTAVSNIRGGI